MGNKGQAQRRRSHVPQTQAHAHLEFGQRRLLLSVRLVRALLLVVDVGARLQRALCRPGRGLGG